MYYLHCGERKWLSCSVPDPQWRGAKSLSDKTWENLVLTNVQFWQKNPSSKQRYEGQEGKTCKQRVQVTPIRESSNNNRFQRFWERKSNGLRCTVASRSYWCKWNLTRFFSFSKEDGDACNLRTRQVETRPTWVQGQPWWRGPNAQNLFSESHRYIMAHVFLHTHTHIHMHTHTHTHTHTYNHTHITTKNNK